MLPTIDRKQVANIQTTENSCTKIESVLSRMLTLKDGRNLYIKEFEVVGYHSIETELTLRKIFPKQTRGALSLWNRDRVNN